MTEPKWLEEIKDRHDTLGDVYSVNSIVPSGQYKDVVMLLEAVEKYREAIHVAKFATGNKHTEEMLERVLNWQPGENK